MKNKKDFRLFNEKRGWIRVVEAFVAILLIAGMVLSLLGGGYIKKEDKSLQIYGVENGILRDIQNNDTSRIEVLNENLTMPAEWSNVPVSIRERVQLDPPNYLICTAKICDIGDSCLLSGTRQEDIYVRSALFSGLTTSRQLKIFCWEK